MARVFETIGEAWARWYDGLSDRERRLISLLFIFLIAVSIISVIYLASSGISRRRASLARQKVELAQVRSLEGDYLEARAKLERANRRIARNDVSLFTFIQTITKRLGLSVKDLNEQRRPLPKSNVMEISVRLNLTKLSIDKVTALIDSIETSEYSDLIKVTRLKVNKRFDEPDLLDLQMTISTWKTA